MGLFDWLRPKPKLVENHTIGSSYSFLFGSTSSGRAVTERIRDADDGCLLVCADFGRGDRVPAATCLSTER